MCVYVCVYICICICMCIYVYMYITRGCWNVDCGPFIHCCPIHWRGGGGGMIFFTKSVIYCLENLDLMILYLCCCEANGPLVHTFQFVRMIINLS